MDFLQWIGKTAEFLGYRPEHKGIEEECLRNMYYTKGDTPEVAAFKHKQSLVGDPKRDKVIRHF